MNIFGVISAIPNYHSIQNRSTARLSFAAVGELAELRTSELTTKSKIQNPKSKIQNPKSKIE